MLKEWVEPAPMADTRGEYIREINELCDLALKALGGGWQPIETAPRDGTWILGLNNRGNPAVIIWKDDAILRGGGTQPGWIHPFSEGYLSSFWNGANGSTAKYWQPITAGPSGS